MAKRKALGRGISAIIPDSNVKVEKKPTDKTSPVEFYHIPVGQIDRNRYQPRQEFEEDALQELSDSIKIHGVIQPITVRRLEKNKYELISGERRLRASKKAGQKTVPAYIREANDEQMVEMALLENTQREDLNPIEVALTYQRLKEEFKLEDDDLAEKVGKGRSTITNFISLLRLSEPIKKGLRNKSISTGHAKSLKGFANKEVADRLLDLVLAQNLSVRQTEGFARQLKKLGDKLDQQMLLGKIEDEELSVKQAEEWVKKHISNKEKADKPIEKPDQNEIILQDLSRKLEDKFGNKVKLKQNQDGKGEIAISFANNDDLTRILEILDI